MSDGEVLILGAIAGFTIFLGSARSGGSRNPVARAQGVPERGRRRASCSSCFWDVLAGAIEPVETSLTDANDHDGSWWRFLGLGALFFAVIGVGLVEPRVLRPMALRPPPCGWPGRRRRSRR